MVRCMVCVAYFRPSGKIPKKSKSRSYRDLADVVGVHRDLVEGFLQVDNRESRTSDVMEEVLDDRQQVTIWSSMPVEFVIVACDPLLVGVFGFQMKGGMTMVE